MSGRQKDHIKPIMAENGLKAESLIDREERAVAALLTRFKNLISLAAAPTEDGATKEVAATQAFQMEVESSALVQPTLLQLRCVDIANDDLQVRAAEDLLQLTRELKEMWLFGPLRGIGEGEGVGRMHEDSKQVGALVEAILMRNSEVPTT